MYPRIVRALRLVLFAPCGWPLAKIVRALRLVLFAPCGWPLAKDWETGEN